MAVQDAGRNRSVVPGKALFRTHASKHLDFSSLKAATPESSSRLALVLQDKPGPESPDSATVRDTEQPQAEKVPPQKKPSIKDIKSRVIVVRSLHQDPAESAASKRVRDIQKQLKPLSESIDEQHLETADELDKAIAKKDFKKAIKAMQVPFDKALKRHAEIKAKLSAMLKENKAVSEKINAINKRIRQVKKQPFKVDQLLENLESSLVQHLRTKIASADDSDSRELNMTLKFALRDIEENGIETFIDDVIAGQYGDAFRDTIQDVLLQLSERNTDNELLTGFETLSDITEAIEAVEDQEELEREEELQRCLDEKTELLKQDTRKRINKVTKKLLEKELKLQVLKTHIEDLHKLLQKLGTNKTLIKQALTILTKAFQQLVHGSKSEQASAGPLGEDEQMAQDFINNMNAMSMKSPEQFLKALKVSVVNLENTLKWKKEINDFANRSSNPARTKRVLARLSEAVGGSITHTLAMMREIKNSAAPNRLIEFLDKVSSDDRPDLAQKGLRLCSDLCILGDVSYPNAIAALACVTKSESPEQVLDFAKHCIESERADTTLVLLQNLSKADNVDEALGFVQEKREEHNLETLVLLLRAKKNKASVLRQLNSSLKKMKKEKEAFDSGKKVIYQKRQGSGIKRIVNGLGGIIGELKVQAEMRNAKTSRGRKVEISKRLKKQHDENVSDIARATFGMQPKK